MGGFNRFKRIERDAERINRLDRRKRCKAGRPGKPVGPKLVRGRGLSRRRPANAIGTLVTLPVAAALPVAVFKCVVVPFLTG